MNEKLKDWIEEADESILREIIRQTEERKMIDEHHIEEAMVGLL